MESKNKHCIINVAYGGWYPKGSERLEKSLYYHGFSGDFLSWRNTIPEGAKDYENDKYVLKIYALENAIKMGYTHILWLDSSVWALQNPDKIFDIINHEGYYLWSSGYNCAQVCSDKCLEYFGITRDEAEKMTDCSTSMVGIFLSNPKAYEFAMRWIEAGKNGVYRGSRFHDNQSADRRFLFHRQDQSAASIIANQLQMKIYEPNIYSCYYEKKMPESVIFCMRGL